jgi:hypothetical protein
MRLLFDVVAVHENVFSTRMAVQVTVEKYFSFFYEGSDKLFDSGVYRMQDLARGFPSTVEILTCERASIIAVDHTVWV